MYVCVVVAVAYKRWSLFRGSNFSDLTRKMLDFGNVDGSRDERLKEVVVKGSSIVCRCVS